MKQTEKTEKTESYKNIYYVPLKYGGKTDYKPSIICKIKKYIKNILKK